MPCLSWLNTTHNIHITQPLSTRRNEYFFTSSSCSRLWGEHASTTNKLYIFKLFACKIIIPFTSIYVLITFLHQTYWNDASYWGKVSIHWPWKQSMSMNTSKTKTGTFSCPVLTARYSRHGYMINWETTPPSSPPLSHHSSLSSCLLLQINFEFVFLHIHINDMLILLG